jgi:hypothetical protein
MVMSDDTLGNFLDLVSGEELHDELRKDVDLILMALYDLLLAKWRTKDKLSRDQPAPHRELVPERLLYWFDLRFNYWLSHSPAGDALEARQELWISQANKVRDDSVRIAGILEGGADPTSAALPRPTAVLPHVVSWTAEPPKSADKEIEDALAAVKARPTGRPPANHDAP